MKYGSLFAGIGGIDLGLERAGMECAWQVEIDDYCRRVLERHWPDVPRFVDVCEVGAHNLEPVDLIAGGFPCQDISQAGKGAGIDGKRSGLWTEFHRIICELRPQFALVENVSALLGRGLGRVLGDLAESGYDAEWDCIPAAAVGAPHRRDRAFIVAHAKYGGLEVGRRVGDSGAKHRHTGGILGINPPGRDVEANEALANPGRELLEGREPAGADHRSELRRNAEWWAVEPDVGRVAYGVSRRVDRLKGLGNAVVPQVAEFIGRRIMEYTKLDEGRE